MAETFCLAWERDARGMGAELEDWAAIEQSRISNAVVAARRSTGASVRRLYACADHRTRVVGRRSGRRRRDRQDDATAAVFELRAGGAVSSGSGT
jgi:hypothetical protein